MQWEWEWYKKNHCNALHWSDIITECCRNAVRVRVGVVGVLLQHWLQSTGGGGEYIFSLHARVVSVTLLTVPLSPPGGPTFYDLTSWHFNPQPDGIFTQLLPVSGGDGCHRRTLREKHFIVYWQSIILITVVSVIQLWNKTCRYWEAVIFAADDPAGVMGGPESQDGGGGPLSSLLVTDSHLLYICCWPDHLCQTWYDYLMVDLRDPRVDSWPLMSSIWPTTAICCVYVYTVKVLGPRYDIETQGQPGNILLE